jgi:hypothetical protein
MQKFFAVTTTTFTTSVKASDIVATPSLRADLVQEALSGGKAFAITSKDKALKSFKQHSWVASTP